MVYRNEEALLRTRQEPVDEPLISGWREAHKTIFTTADALDLELLPRLDIFLLAELRGDNDPALGRNGNSHTRKDIVYGICVKRAPGKIKKGDRSAPPSS
jgi:hypothetical protein